MKTRLESYQDSVDRECCKPCRMDLREQKNHQELFSSPRVP